MSDELNPKQALFLWKLLTAETEQEREPQKSKARPNLKKDLRPLVDRGYVTLEKRPKRRGEFVVATDKAWAWAADTLDVELMKSHSSVGAEALQGLLRRLLPFLQRESIPLASVLAPTNPETDASEAKHGSGNGKEPAPQRTAIASGASLPDRIETVCLAIAGGARKTRVRLSALRRELDSVPREVLDRALLDLQSRGRLVLYRDDNTAALTDDDRNAALWVGDAPRHLILLEA